MKIYHHVPLIAESRCSRRLSHTKCSFPFRTTAFNGFLMSFSSSRSLDKNGMYSFRIASCNAILEVEMTAGWQSDFDACPPLSPYLSSMIHAIKYAYVFPIPTPASQSAICFPHKEFSICRLSRSCSSRTFNPCFGMSS